MDYEMQQHTLKTPYSVGEVHCYSTEVDGKLILFDSGPPTEEAFIELKSQLDLSRLQYIFITHCHIDHYGLVPRICDYSGARVFIPRTEAAKFRHWPEYQNDFVHLLSEFGCSEQTTEYIRETNERDYLATTCNLKYYEITEYSEVATQLGIKYLNCAGHSQSDLVYILGDHAITGDILLRNIFQEPYLDINTSDFSGRFRSYDSYCNSLQSLIQLRGLHIHPGHRWYVKDIDECILLYVRKVLDLATRIKELATCESINVTVKALFGDIFKKPFLVYAKISEIVFIMDFIENPGLLKASLEYLGIFDSVRNSYYAVV